jgi:uncharacterized protein (TIGR04255 family)
MTMRYGNAPIIEAILDLRVEPRPGVSAIEIGAGFSELTDEFPNRQELPAETGLQITFGPGGPPRLTSGPVLGGFRYESADGRRIMQARRDGFVFSLLPPYEDWETFCGETRPLWERYRTAWQPRKIVRAALRYVNQFDFSVTPDASLAQHFTIAPGSPTPGLLPLLKMTGYSLQMVLPQPDIEATAVLNHALVPSPPDTVSIVLDIDLFREPLAWDPNDDSELWNRMSELRERKNALFEACITPQTRELLRPQQ